MGKVLCIGEALIDMICTDKGKPLSAGENFLKKPGGAPTNVAAAIAALRGSVELCAKVGDDPFGNCLVNTMKEFGIGTNFIKYDKRNFTTFAYVSLMKNGERDFFFNRGADAELSIEDCAEIDVRKFSIIHFGSATAFLPGKLHKAYFNLLEKSKQNNAFISFDPNYRNLLFNDKKNIFIKNSWHFINNCNFFKVSDEEALLLTSTKSVEAAASCFNKNAKAVFAITLGAKGTLLGVDGNSHLIPSIKIKPVDTTGAGDAFVGSILYNLSILNKEKRLKLKPKDWVEIVYDANRAGANTCKYMGAMEAFRRLQKTNIHK